MLKRLSILAVVMVAVSAFAQTPQMFNNWRAIAASRSKGTAPTVYPDCWTNPNLMVAWYKFHMTNDLVRVTNIVNYAPTVFEAYCPASNRFAMVNGSNTLTFVAANAYLAMDYGVGGAGEPWAGVSSFTHSFWWFAPVTNRTELFNKDANSGTAARGLHTLNFDGKFRTVWNDYDGSYSMDVTCPDSWPTGKWVMVTYTYNAANKQFLFYTNAALSVTGAFNEVVFMSWTNSGVISTLGNDNATTRGGWNKQFDEFVFLKTNLSQADILAWFNYEGGLNHAQQ